jgi:hypothetical protein
VHSAIGVVGPLFDLFKGRKPSRTMHPNLLGGCRHCFDDSTETNHSLTKHNVPCLHTKDFSFGKAQMTTTCIASTSTPIASLLVPLHDWDTAHVDPRFDRFERNT